MCVCMLEGQKKRETVSECVCESVSACVSVCVCLSVSVCVSRGLILYTIVLECVRERECVC